MKYKLITIEPEGTTTNLMEGPEIVGGMEEDPGPSTDEGENPNGGNSRDDGVRPGHVDGCMEVDPVGTLEHESEKDERMEMVKMDYVDGGQNPKLDQIHPKTVEIPPKPLKTTARARKLRGGGRGTKSAPTGGGSTTDKGKITKYFSNSGNSRNELNINGKRSRSNVMECVNDYDGDDMRVEPATKKLFMNDKVAETKLRGGPKSLERTSRSRLSKTKKMKLLNGYQLISNFFKLDGGIPTGD